MYPPYRMGEASRDQRERIVVFDALCRGNRVLESNRVQEFLHIYALV